MSDRGTTTARGKGKQQQEEALQDLKRFIMGQHHQLPPQVQQEGLLDDIAHIVNDELIRSLERILEDAIFMRSDELDTDALVEYWPAKQLLNKLRDLQKVRLRDALESTVRFAEC